MEVTEKNIAILYEPMFPMLLCVSKKSHKKHIGT